MARLRTKLAEYAAGEGVSDPFLIEVPKGAYRLLLLAKPAAISDLPAPAPPLGEGTAAPSPASDVPPPLPQRRVTLGRFAILLWFVSAAGLLLALWAGELHLGKPRTVEVAVRQFWLPFAAEAQGPLVILSNAPFAGTPMTGLHYGTASQAASGKLEAHYTGVGEALGVHSLDALFYRFKRPVRVRLANSLAIGEAKDQNLIFLGAPIENPMLGKVLSLRNFTFKSSTDDPLETRGEILNQLPRPGEPPSFKPPTGAAASEDYALISRTPLDASHVAIVAAGTTTLGTEAAVDFICSPASLAELARRLGYDGQNRSYDVVLRVKIVDDTPIHSDIVAVRFYPNP